MSSPVTPRLPAGTTAQWVTAVAWFRPRARSGEWLTAVRSRSLLRIAGRLVALVGLGGSGLVRRRGRRPDASGGAV